MTPNIGTTRHATGQQTSGDMTSSVPVLAAVWCRSVGSTWTLELHHPRRGTPPMTLLDWISSGVPIAQPQPPEELEAELLTQRGLHLFRDPLTGPCTNSRRGIGYAARNPELITLAHLIQVEAIPIGLHPVMLAAQWIAAGFSADAAARWIRQGIHSPQPTPPPRTSATSRQQPTAPHPITRLGRDVGPGAPCGRALPTGCHPAPACKIRDRYGEASRETPNPESDGRHLADHRSEPLTESLPSYINCYVNDYRPP
jgi:hypothetical protein